MNEKGMTFFTVFICYINANRLHSKCSIDLFSLSSEIKLRGDILSPIRPGPRVGSFTNDLDNKEYDNGVGDV